MKAFAKDLIFVLQHLLPGFISAWVFYAFTSYSKPSQFERVVQALIFTLLIQVGVKIAKYILIFLGQFWFITQWSDFADLSYSIIIAMILGILFAYFANNDKFHKFIRQRNITNETSYPSEWFGAFNKKGTYIVLHLHDERRLYGWPLEWPSEPNQGYFVLTQVSWLENNKEILLTGIDSSSVSQKVIPLEGVDRILIDVKDVKWVEFMEITWDQENE